MKTYTVNFQPVGKRVEVEAGTTLLDAAQRAGVGLSAVCGGSGVCDTCRVYIREGKVSSPSIAEQMDLDEEDLAEGLRLACQTEVLGDVRVDVPAGSLSAPQRTQVEGDTLDVPVEPAVTAHVVQLKPATQDDLRSDWSRLCDALCESGVERPLSASRPVLAALPAALRMQDWQVSAMVRQGVQEGCEVVRIGAPNDVPLGFAVDVGTTKLAGYLVDLQTGHTLGMQGRMNPQIAYGEDVMSRINYAMQGEEHAQTLQRVLVEALDEMIASLCHESGTEPSHVVDMVVAANTAMHHLFLGLPVEQLGTAPYVAAASDALNVRAVELGFSIAPGAYVYVLPNIAGFVGADHVAMLLASNIPAMEGVVVGLDIGTNTEVTLSADGKLYACSTASGPAFEGAHIRDGMRASEGAIERFRLVDGEMQYQTIGSAPPVGMCGSGILDMVAELRKAEILSLSGAMGDHARVTHEEHGPVFLIASAGESGHGADIWLTRSDVSEIQLAKGAMRAGVKILLEEAGLTEEDIDWFIVAGAFGSYIDVDSAVTVGMFPPLPHSRYRQIGNAAGMGARQCLVSRSERVRGEAIARRVHYLELTNDARFTDRFSQAVVLAEMPWT